MGPFAALTVVTPPAMEAISLDEIKDQVEWDSDVDRDALFADHAASAREWYEDAAGRTLIETLYDVAFDSFPGQGEDPRTELHRRRSEQFAIELPRGPLKATGGVTSVKYRDASNVLQTLAADQYEVIGTDPALILPAFAVGSWPSALVRPSAVVVRMTAGYGVEPKNVRASIRHFLRLLVAHTIKEREPIITGTIVNELPFALQSLFWSTRAALAA